MQRADRRATSNFHSPESKPQFVVQPGEAFEAGDTAIVYTASGAARALERIFTAGAASSREKNP